MNFSDGVTQLKLAAFLNVSRAQVSRLIDKGIFKIDDSKRVSLSQAQEAYTEYLKTVDVNKQNNCRKRATALLEEIQQKQNLEGENFEATFKNWLSQIEADPITVLNCAKAYLTALQTKQEKIKLDELEGRLFPIEKINADAEEAGNLIRSKLMSLPARVATVCEGRSARDIEEIITDEINSALEDLQKLFV